MPLNNLGLDELIAARRALHGGGRGRPRNAADNTPQGSTLNQGCILVLSASLQQEVERVFMLCSRRRLGALDDDKNYRRTWSRWGNPSASNIISLFNKLGREDILLGLAWPNMTNATLKENLKKWNEIRNDIAHGTPLMYKDRPFSLTLAKVMQWRNTANQFADRFEQHALGQF